MAPCARRLLIEDDPCRIEAFRHWLPQGKALIIARSAGQAIGVLRRLRPGDIRGLILDHDLRQKTLTSADEVLCGSHLVALVIGHFSRDVPLLVHSQNEIGATAMRTRLEQAGFDITRIPMDELTLEPFPEGIEDGFGNDP